MAHEVVAALIIRSQKVLLGKRSAGRMFYPGVWDVFGGHMESGEGQHETLIRELQEELGMTPVEWRYLQTIRAPFTSAPDEPPGMLTLHLYLVTDWTGTITNRQLEEHSEIGWFSLAQTEGLSLAHPGYPAIFARYLPADPGP